MKKTYLVGKTDMQKYLTKKKINQIKATLGLVYVSGGKNVLLYRDSIIVKLL